MILPVPDSTCEDFYALNWCKSPLQITNFLRRISEESWHRVPNLLYYSGEPGFQEAFRKWAEKNKDNLPIYTVDYQGRVVKHHKQDSNE